MPETPVHTIMSRPFMNGSECCIARCPYPGNLYFIAFARAYGMACSRLLDIINCTTCGPEMLELSESKRPLVWFDSFMNRMDFSSDPFHPEGHLAALLKVDPPVIKLTGRKKYMYADEGGAREASEVEILLPEESLARVCYLCRGTEYNYGDARFERLPGTSGYQSLYVCEYCASMCKLRKWIAETAANRRLKSVQSKTPHSNCRGIRFLIDLGLFGPPC
ncbi:hypothetical protein CPB84DRAFT_1728052 [Gymnopilus junonius]|uniref:Uncharacterized protein n=1 Tax=Gymnopilus junonius TaxID=109634 RepID=A0A9P5NSN0_GYMJU|nr:hypothetical protein CPB84DRAFT_1728052 [Gymnopilus junonius]